MVEPTLKAKYSRTTESRPTTPHLEPDVAAGPSSRLLGHPEGFRPISGYSGTSGESGSTLFHDAQSRPETPPPLPSPPPALTTSSRSRLPMAEPMQESTSEAPPFGSSELVPRPNLRRMIWILLRIPRVPLWSKIHWMLQLLLPGFYSLSRTRPNVPTWFDCLQVVDDIVWNPW
jgi:hypothetical protein